ncbi:hypothetical protein WMY93_032964 [Mugilogobius chulae]|uniref:Dynein heavy chain region D6 P-loop domain-containing protein n=1 Tax=Mugilogobius chulae TaxID=88201 RepID=A0AAW0MLM5_9GOBI
MGSDPRRTSRDWPKLSSALRRSYTLKPVHKLVQWVLGFLLSQTYSWDQGAPCRPISMGQGQEVHARRLLAQSRSDGGWLLLQNCHLGLHFLDELLESVTCGSEEEVHPGFRVWITTDVHDKFPITFLQSSIKFTNEPPLGESSAPEPCVCTTEQTRPEHVCVCSQDEGRLKRTLED